MRGDGKPNGGTRDRILEASGEVFAELGFRNATVRKICDRAGVNVAAISYHFRSKEELYFEVLKNWHEYAIKKYPPLLDAGEGAPVEEQLRAFVRSFLFRMLDRGKPAWFGKLMAREMAEPTRAFDHMVKEVMLPLNRLLESIVQRMLGPDVAEETVRLCCASIFGQCIYYYNTRCVVQFFERDMTDPEEIERIADHITGLTLSGLRLYSGTDHVRGQKGSLTKRRKTKLHEHRTKQPSFS